MAKKTTKTLKVTAPGFSLVSNWFCTKTGSGKNEKYKFVSGYPSSDAWSIWFTYEIPSGAKIKSAVAHVKITDPNTGISVLSANGARMVSKGKGVYSANITVTSKSRTKVKFVFKANGSKSSADGRAPINFSDVYLQIKYESSASAATQKKKQDAMSVPPQTCCLYDPGSGKVYMFDGVVRIQHQNSVKLEEEPNAEKYTYVNNALNEPDKVTLDVIMSDVYTGTSALDSAPSVKSDQERALNAGKGAGLVVETSRSANAFGVLKELKESRQYLEVVTPQHVYVEMMITSIVANQDESCPYGWSGQITFQSKYTPINAGYNANPQDAGDAVPTPSNIALWFDPPKQDPVAATQGMIDYVTGIVSGTFPLVGGGN